MRLDHVSYAAEPDGMVATAERMSTLLGEPFSNGGAHPRFGTRNMVLPLRGGQYLEVVEVLDHPASDKVPFGQAVRARSAAGGGWLGWVIAVDEIGELEDRLGRPAVQGNRRRPDGYDLRWKQLGVQGLQSDPQLPFIVQWEVPAAAHPSASATGQLGLASLQIAGSREQVEEWLGAPVADVLGDVQVEWAVGQDQPGIIAATVSTPAGVVRL